MNAICDHHGLRPGRNPKSWKREAGIGDMGWFDLHANTRCRRRPNVVSQKPRVLGKKALR
jgi:hypothetical protein